MPGQIEHWLGLAERSQEPDASRARLKAVTLLLDNEQWQRARASLTLVNAASLRDNEQDDLLIAKARLLSHAGEHQQVLDTLTNISASPSRAQEAFVGRLRAEAYYFQNDPLEAARQRVYIQPLLDTPESKRENERRIWQALNSLDKASIETQARQEPAVELRGWLTLTLLHKLYQFDILKQRRQLAIWQSEWHDHPASINLPDALQNLSALAANIPKRVVLLLPLSGRLANASAAIRDGFLASYYEADRAEGMNIQVVDSSEHRSFNDTWNAALSHQPDMIVGPLSKPEIAALQPLIQTDGPTVLALNYSNSEEPSGFYQFGLAAADEAIQIADTLSADGPQRALIIRPTGGWGERVSGAFKQRWQASDGIVLDEVSYSKSDNLSGLLKRALLSDRSEYRKDRIARLLGEKLEFTPRRRKDVDFFLLLARPEQARQLKPILAFHYAGDVPVYSTSQVFAGKAQRHRDRDLNGITFTETPWLLDSDNPLRDALSNLDADSSAFSRMQAFGADAFQLTMRLAYLAQNPGSAYQGASGNLSVKTNGKIRRELDLAQFVRGTPRRIPKPETAESIE